MSVLKGLKLPPPPTEEEMRAHAEAEQRARAEQRVAAYRSQVALVASHVAAGLLAQANGEGWGDDESDAIAKQSVLIARKIVLRANTQALPTDEEFKALADELVQAGAVPAEAAAPTEA